jgi:flagellin
MSSSGFASSKDKNVSSLASAQADLRQSMERLASGKRINRASDDAAGLAIADALKSDAVVLRQANRNIADAQSLTDIADSTLSQAGDISIRMQELAVQSANGTLNDSQRGALNQEYQQLGQELQRMSATTEFNGKNVFSGSSSIQVGGDSSSDSQLSVDPGQLDALTSAAVGQSISSVDSARSALDSVAALTSSISQSLGSLGAQSARLDVAAANNSSGIVNSLAAESRIRDVDVADEKARNISAMIRSQNATALYAQVSKVDRDRVLDLLR